MAYDGMYGDLSTRGTTNEILTEVREVQSQVLNSEANVEVLASETENNAALSQGYADTAAINAGFAGNAAVVAVDAQNAVLAAQAEVKEHTLPFLGSFPSDPATRTDGSPLQIGDRYFNTTVQAEYIYTDTGWKANESMEAIQDLSDNLANEVASSLGANLVGWDGETLSSQLTQDKKLPNYQSIRDYTGLSTQVSLKTKKYAGTFVKRNRVLGDLDDGGITLLSSDGLYAWDREFDGPISAAWFGLKSDNTTDDAPAINAAFNAIAAKSGPELYGSGGIVTLPHVKKGRSLIKSPIRVKFGCTLQGGGSDIYQSNLYVAPDFVGAAAVIVMGDAGVSYTNGHVKEVGISCNNVPNVGGILFAGAYNNSSIEDSFVIGVHGNAIGIEVRTMTNLESPSPTTVCESILLKDLYVLHHDDYTAVVKPTIKLSKCQESTLINVKAFSNRNNAGSQPTNQSAFLFEDCRGITVIGGAAVGCKYGITISAVSRFAVGFKITGFTHELVTDFGLRSVGTPSFGVSGISYDLPRYEAPQPTSGFYGEYTSNSVINTGIKGFSLGLGVTAMEMHDFGVGTVVADATARYVRYVTPNAVNNRTVLSATAGIEINTPVTTPGFRFTTGTRTDFWNLNWSASDAVNNGFQLANSSGRTPWRANDNGTAATIGFLGANPVARPTVTGSRGGNAALASVLTALANLGLITDSTTA